MARASTARCVVVPVAGLRVCAVRIVFVVVVVVFVVVVIIKLWSQLSLLSFWCLFLWWVVFVVVGIAVSYCCCCWVFVVVVLAAAMLVCCLCNGVDLTHSRRAYVCPLDNLPHWWWYALVVPMALRSDLGVVTHANRGQKRDPQ